MQLNEILASESTRHQLFPATKDGIYLGHAGVAPMPRAAIDAIGEYCRLGARGNQESPFVLDHIDRCRDRGAALIGAQAKEIALLGPTSLGLSLVARGLDWQPGDEVIYYGDDYPANVYPWTALAQFGVTPVPLKPAHPGVITPELVEAAITKKTKLIALASCHFLSGYRIDIPRIGQLAHAHGALFCVDGIQTLGAFPMSVEHVDFLSADSHKWMLGPGGAGIFYVAEALQDRLQPALLGSWNVVSPEFVAQPSIAFEPSARRYEPGILNFPGICGMSAALDLLLDLGIHAIADRLLHLRAYLLEGLRAKGYALYIEEWDTGNDAEDANRSAIVAVDHPKQDMAMVFEKLRDAGITASLRRNRDNRALLRLSPHFYITEHDLDRTLAEMPG